MIYLAHTTEEQMLFIPKTKRNSDGAVFIRLFSPMNLIGMIKDVQMVEETITYYKVKVKLPSVIAPGEYEYGFYDMRDSLSSGILVVGEPSKAVEYNKTIEYEQYKAE